MTPDRISRRESEDIFSISVLIADDLDPILRFFVGLDLSCLFDESIVFFGLYEYGMIYCSQKLR